MTARAVREAGGVPVVAPILRIERREGPLLGDAADGGEGTVLAFTSANGVRAYAEGGGGRRPAFCVGPLTAAAARAAGLPVAGVADGAVAPLAALLTAAAPARVLHVRGAHAAGDLTGRLAAAGIPAAPLILYEAVPATRLPEAAEGALRAGADVLLYSPRSARLLAQLMREAGLADALRDRRVAALSEGVAQAFDLPIGAMRVPPAASRSGLVDFLLDRRT